MYDIISKCRAIKWEHDCKYNFQRGVFGKIFIFIYD